MNECCLQHRTSIRLPALRCRRNKLSPSSMNWLRLGRRSLSTAAPWQVNWSATRRSSTAQAVATSDAPPVGRIEERELHVEASESYLAYAMSVIVGRALPDVRDGLKPVHRRILFALHELGMGPKATLKKCARVVGEVLGKYHPHGDTAVYEALVRLAQDFSMREPLITGQGNFGSVDNDPPAAMRYTECRMAPVAADMLLADLSPSVVSFVPTFDASNEEPLVLPARLPQLLINGSSGIAVGIATRIPPHNMAEVAAGLRALIANPDISIQELMQHIPGPDFPTGGEILDGSGIAEAYKKGQGSITMRGKVAIEDESSAAGKKPKRARKGKEGAGEGGEAAPVTASGSGRSSIVITELPYQVCKSELVARIAELVEEKVIEGVADVRDESDRTGLRVVVELKRGAAAELLLNQLYKHTKLQSKFPCNMVALVDGVPKTLTLKDMLRHFLDFRCDVIKRRAQAELTRSEARLHVVEGLLSALASVDSVVAIVRESADGAEARAALVAQLGLSETQADAVLALTLRRLTGLEEGKLKEEQAALTSSIADLRDLLSKQQRVLDIVGQEAAELVSRYGSPRRSRLSLAAAATIEVEDVVPDAESLLMYSSRGFIKRVKAETFRTQARGGTGKVGASLRQGDAVEEMVRIRDHDDVLVFTQRGRAYSLKAHQVPEASRTAGGTAIAQLLKFEKGDGLSAIVPMRGFGPEASIFLASTKGEVKRVEASQFAKLRSNGLTCMGVDPADSLAFAARCEEGSSVLLAGSNGKVLHFSAGDVRCMGRAAKGMRGMKLQPGQSVVAMAVLPPSLASTLAAAPEGDEGEEADEPQEDEIAGAGGEEASGSGPWLLFASTDGRGVRVDIRDMRITRRGNQGVVGMKTEDPQRVVGLRVVEAGDELVIASSQGLVTRINVDTIRVSNRRTKGVKIMNLQPGDTVQAVTVAPARQEPPRRPATATDSAASAHTTDAPSSPSNPTPHGSGSRAAEQDAAGLKAVTAPAGQPAEPAVVGSTRQRSRGTTSQVGNQPPIHRPL